MKVGIRLLAGLMLVAVVWGSAVYCPWWRVRVVVDREQIDLTMSRVRLAYVMGRLGVWKEGVRSAPIGEKKTGAFVVPKWVVIYVDRDKYESNWFVDKESGEVVYSVRDEYDKNRDTLVLTIGVRDESKMETQEMINMLNSQIFTTFVRLARPSMETATFNEELVAVYKGIKPYWRRLVSKYESR